MMVIVLISTRCCLVLLFPLFLREARYRNNNMNVIGGRCGLSMSQTTVEASTVDVHGPFGLAV